MIWLVKTREKAITDKVLDQIIIQNMNGAANDITVLVKSITAKKADGTTVDISKDKLSIADWAGSIE